MKRLLIGSLLIALLLTACGAGEVQEEGLVTIYKLPT